MGLVSRTGSHMKLTPRAKHTARDNMNHRQAHSFGSRSDFVGPPCQQAIQITEPGSLGLVKVKETLSSHPDHRKPHPMFKPCARANGKGDNHRCQWAEAVACGHVAPLCGCLEIGPPDCTKTAFRTMSPYCETSILATKHTKPLRNDVNCLSSTRALGTGGRPDHGPKKGPTNLEAGLLTCQLRPRFWVRIWPFLGGRSQNTNRGCSIFGNKDTYAVHVLPSWQPHISAILYILIHTQFYIPIYTAHIT
jgi:hypothetical protein